jgi:hypothetical protein
VTPQQINERLCEAGRTLLSLPMPRHSYPTGYRSAWPDTVQSHVDWFAAQVMADEDNRLEMLAGRNNVRVRPLQRQIDGLDEVLSWVLRIRDGRHRRVVTLRSLVHPITGRHLYGWRRLARALDAHENTIRNWHAQGIDDILAGETSCRPTQQFLVKDRSVGVSSA